jgi:hypothetical protein
MDTAQPSYDIAVAYRVYPRLSRGAEGFGMPKFDLASLCLRSFRQCLGPVQAKVWALLDNCPDPYEKLFREVFPPEDLEVVRFPGVGNSGTFKAQLEILSGQVAAPLVYLAEDDYLYRPGMLASMVEFISANPDVDFVSPFDHPDYYTLPLTRPRCTLRVCGSTHWRTAGSTCLTFMTRRETLRETRPVFETYTRRNYDSSLWMSLTKHRIFNPGATLRLLLRSRVERMTVAKAWLFGWRQVLFGPTRRLWTPVPSIATHLVCGGLAYGVDWRVYGLPAGSAAAG